MGNAPDPTCNGFEDNSKDSSSFTKKRVKTSNLRIADCQGLSDFQNMNSVLFKEVFHPSDFSVGDASAFAHALRIALSAKGELKLVHVIPSHEHVHWSNFPSVRAVLENWGLIEPGARPEILHQLGFDVKKIQRSDDDPVRSISSLIAEHNPDLLVLSTHQPHGFDRLLHPSLAEETAEKSSIPTLFIPRGKKQFIEMETGTVRLRNILIPIGHSPDCQCALDAAASLARVLNVQEVHFSLLYVGKAGEEPELRFNPRQGWSCEKNVWDGNVVENIIESAKAQNADLIVMATRGHDNVFDGLRGTTTEQVLRRTNCPLVAVPERSPSR